VHIFALFSFWLYTLTNFRLCCGPVFITKAYDMASAKQPSKSSGSSSSVGGGGSSGSDPSTPAVKRQKTGDDALDGLYELLEKAEADKDAKYKKWEAAAEKNSPLAQQLWAVYEKADALYQKRSDDVAERQSTSLCRVRVFV